MKRALLVIDVQNEYFTGAPVTHPIGHLGKILRPWTPRAGRRRPPTVVIRHAFPDPTTPFFLKGSHGWQLHPEVEARPPAPGRQGTPRQLHRHRSGSLAACQDVDTVTIVGYMTHMCCDTTARQAMHLGLKVEFLSDATGTLPVRNEAGEVTAEELHRAILCAQQMMISEVLDTEAWVGRVEGA
ncbi:MAG: isochorismatase family protein [Isosphaeraceae bacterium]